MEHKHTPGPWTVEPPSGSEPEYDSRAKDYWSIRAPGSNGCISHEVARLSGWNIDRDEHTARLIAAAPELLESLIKAEKALMELEHMTGGGDGEINIEPEILAARAAIAKATGATPKPMRWPGDFPGKHDKQEKEQV